MTMIPMRIVRYAKVGVIMVNSILIVGGVVLLARSWTVSWMYSILPVGMCILAAFIGIIFGRTGAMIELIMIIPVLCMLILGVIIGLGASMLSMLGGSQQKVESAAQDAYLLLIVATGVLVCATLKLFLRRMAGIKRADSIPNRNAWNL